MSQYMVSRCHGWRSRGLVLHHDHTGSCHGSRNEVMLVTDHHVPLQVAAQDKPHHQLRPLTAAHLHILLPRHARELVGVGSDVIKESSVSLRIREPGTSPLKLVGQTARAENNETLVCRVALGGL